MKTCTGCKKEKPRSEFWPDRSKKKGIAARCKNCKAAASKAWRDANPHKAKERYWGNRDGERERHLRRKYGITFVDYNAMLAEQGGKCAICLAPEPPHKTLDVDHCHATGIVRGLLCTSCNRMLGHAGDSPNRLLAGAEYLSRKSRRSSSEPSTKPPRY